MAISIDVGIEGVSYQPQGAGLGNDFPHRKENLHITASVPSHLEEVFRLHVHTQRMENLVAPKISNGYVTSPSDYSRLFGEIKKLVGSRVPGNEQERKVLQEAQTLLGSMKENFDTFNAGRNALIQG